MNDIEYINKLMELTNTYIEHTTNMILDFNDSLNAFQTDFVQTANNFHKALLDAKVNKTRSDSTITK